MRRLKGVRMLWVGYTGGMERERIFLGWDRSALLGAVAFLHDRYAPRPPLKSACGGEDDQCAANQPLKRAGLEDISDKQGGDVWDMRDVVVVVPVARAGRRLLELLVRRSEQSGGGGLINDCIPGASGSDDAAVRCKSSEGVEGKADATGGGGLFPPRIVTVGELPELLYEPKRGLVDQLRGRLMRMEVLKEAGNEVLGKVMEAGMSGELSDDHGGGLSGWGMAEQFEKLSSDLAAGRLRACELIDKCEELGLDLGGEGAHERWASIHKLDDTYHVKLKELGLSDRQWERLEAIEEGRCRFKGDLVLVGIADQNAMLGAMIKQAALAEGEGRFSALVHCEEKHADGFDEVGGLVVKYWEKQGVSVGNEQLRFVEKESDLGGEVVRSIAELGVAKGECIDADDVTVGLCDEGMAGEIGRAMDLAGLPVRYAGGKPMMWSGPVVMLGALGRYADGQHWEDFAAVVRHVDFERYVRDQVEVDGTNQELGEVELPSETLSEYLVKMDGYAAEHIQGRLLGLVGDEDKEVVEILRGYVDGLLPEDVGEKKGVGEWGKAIAGMLRKVYGERELKRYAERDEPVYQVLKGLGRVLKGMVELAECEGDGFSLEMTFSEAVGLVLGQLKEVGVPPLGGDSAVELMGTLDLQMDDAWGLVVTGFNEGKLPASRNADAFLPDGLRAGLGLMDNARRYARDVMMVNALIRSRGVVRFIAAKKTREGDPLMPSRLMLACGDEELVGRVMGFYREDREVAGDEVVLMKPGVGEHGFLVPRPDERGVKKMYVTGFRDYLACPYRFYLKHVARLGRVDDDVVELDGGGFGSLAHKVLEGFGRDESIRDCQSSVEIMDYLSNRLDYLVAKKFGKYVRAAVRIQVEQLRERLMVFAGVQATRRMQGWKVRGDLVEWRYAMDVVVDGEKSLQIVGKIDRIDEHADGRLCLIDYKTGDGGKKPEAVHRRGGEWVDLQLPLYVEMVKDAGLVNDEVEVGFMNLPRRLEDTGLQLARWDDEELSEARGVRDEVIRQVTGKVFWPPRERRGAMFEDGFERICGDKVFDWEELIARSGEVK
ncbi:PD-(D/E)XK nuclease family protein [Planctomycetota bacterium]|nr:PD-(D/E)XK nuclease family protein [Planctomycetota bacterium]